MISELMDRFGELALTWTWLLFLATWRAWPVFVLVAGLGLAFRQRLSPAIHALLWTIVLARLLLPVSIGTPLSLHGPIDALAAAISQQPVDGMESNAHATYRNSLLPNLESIEKADWTRRDMLPRRATNEGLAWEKIVGIAIASTMLLVTAGMLVRSIVSHVRFTLRLRSCRVLDDQRLIDWFLRECDSLGVGRRPTLREVPFLNVPAVFGFWRPTICLPPDLISTLTEQELRWVLRHELAHIYRRDIAVMVMASIAAACHWFNPVVWFTLSRLRAAMEAAADRKALASLSQKEAVSYSRLLLRLAECSIADRRSPTPTLGLLPFASGKHLKQRVELLMQNNRGHGIVAKSLAALLVTAITCIGLTDAKEFHQETPVVHIPTGETITASTEELDFDPWLTRDDGGPDFLAEYDIDGILKTIPSQIADRHEDLQSQLTHWVPLPPKVCERLRVEGRILIANLNARQHQLLKQTLETWKDGEPRQVTIETRLIQTNIDTASSIDWARQLIEGLDVQGTGPALAARMKEQELAELVRGISSDQKGRVLFAPKVTLFDGQTASIADQVQRPFVTGVDPQSDGTLKPVVSVVDEGLTFVLSPKLNSDDSLSLTFEIRASNIGKVSYANLPIRLPHQSERRFTVQVPATERYTVSSTVKLQAGESVVVAIPRVFNLEPGADSDSTVLVALTPRINPRQN